MDYGADSYHRFLQGEQAALEELVVLYIDSLIGFAYCYVKDTAAAEDIMAETFASLIVKRKQFKEDAHFKTYLYKIARNKAIDHLRTRSRFVSLGKMENMLKGASAEYEFFREEQNRRLYACMQTLPPQYRDVLYLVYFENFSIQETCGILKKNAKQVYNLLARARSALKEILMKEGVYNEEL